MEQYPLKNGTWTFGNQLRRHISANLRQFTVQRDDREGTRRAAVALTLVNTGSESLIYDIPNHEPAAAALVLTRRSERLNSHAGQWALPGGRIDVGETPESAALRELREEVGVELASDAILGRLDDFTTRSGYTITPIVMWGEKNMQLTANPAEVDSIHRIPVAEFLRQDAPVLRAIPESDQPRVADAGGPGMDCQPDWCNYLSVSRGCPGG